MAAKMGSETFEEDDFDYSIKFPTPGITKPFKIDIPPNEHLEGTEVYLDKEPVVFLLGWMGCKDKHLEKFNDIYSQRCICILYTAPRDYILYEPEKLEELAKKLLGIVFDLGYQDNPIFIHAFSNGGGSVYRYMSDLLQHDPFFHKLRMSGAIFDSLPAQESASATYRAVVESHKDLSFPLRHLYGFGFASLVFALNLMFYILSYFGVKKSRSKEDFSQYMYNESPAWPCLYLYSKSDAIVNYCHVESVIEHRKRMGADITHVRWDDCPHVQLYRMNKEDYRRHCQVFIQQSLFSSIFEDSDGEYDSDTF